jgi:transcriptional regulator with XRE-family HTH domain
MSDIHMNIKRLRKSNGWTQTQLAKILGTSQKVITSYETGVKKPPINRLPDLAAVFGVTIEEIIGEKPLTINGDTPHTHKNSRAAKMQELYDKLSPDEQRVILKQVKTLVVQN